MQRLAACPRGHFPSHSFCISIIKQTSADQDLVSPVRDLTKEGNGGTTHGSHLPFMFLTFHLLFMILLINLSGQIDVPMEMSAEGHVWVGTVCRYSSRSGMYMRPLYCRLPFTTIIFFSTKIT